MTGGSGPDSGTAAEGKPRVIVVGITSGIGEAVGRAFAARDWSVIGTVRNACVSHDTHLTGVIDHCELGEVDLLDRAIPRILEFAAPWDALVMAPGTMEPIGLLGEVDAGAWAHSIDVNFVNQVRLVRGLLHHARRDRELQPIVIFFAGGGSNSAPIGFSAYTVAKIALTKMTEILDAEYPDVRFCIIGPGWVETKIHNQSLTSTGTPIDVRQETERRIGSNDFVSMTRVVEAVLWAQSAPKAVIGGRNISVARDPFDDPRFSAGLGRDSELFKLRRSGNGYKWMELS